MYLSNNGGGRCLFVIVAYFGCSVFSIKTEGLANKHLKIVAVPWKPFLVWKCPHTEFVDWWQIDKDYAKNWKMEDVYYGDTHLQKLGIENSTQCPNGEDRMYGGILWEFLMFMKQAKNLTYTIVAIDDAWWGGTCHDTNNCTGMVGSVNRQEADIALGLYNI